MGKMPHNKGTVLYWLTRSFRHEKICLCSSVFKQDIYSRPAIFSWAPSIDISGRNSIS